MGTVNKHKSNLFPQNKSENDSSFSRTVPGESIQPERLETNSICVCLCALLIYNDLIFILMGQIRRY